MNDGMKSTVVGVLLSAVLAGMGAEIGLTINHGQHFAKIDSVLESQSKILEEIKRAGDTVPAVVEKSFGEVRERLKMIEYRTTSLESKTEKK